MFNSVILLNGIQVSVILLGVSSSVFVGCHSAKCHTSECHSGKCHISDCHSAQCHISECHSDNCHIS